MRNTSGVVRLALTGLAVAGLAVGATRVDALGSDATVQLAQAQGRAGLPESTDVLVRESEVLCPGPQRVGLTGLRDVAGTVTVTASAPPAAALAEAGLAADTSSTASTTGSTSSTGRITLGDGTSASLGVTAPDASADAATAAKAGAVTARPTASALVTATATGGLAPGLAATQTWWRAGDDDRGLAVTPCTLPASDAWLVGGGGGPSRSERVVVANPGGNAVSVSFEVFGAKGPVASADGRDVSVPPRSRVAVSLDALALGETRPAVHVVATGGVVSAVLDDAWIDGATGRGIDDSVRAAAPATDLVVAGVDDDGESLVRVANPGTREALVQVRVLTDRGPSQPEALRAVRVPAGSTADVPLALGAGRYGLRLTSDQPVVAAAWVERRQASGADRMGDFAWAPATPAVHGLAGVQIAGARQPGGTATLVVAAGDGGADATVHLRSRSAAGAVTDRALPVTVGVDSVATVDVSSADEVWLSVQRGEPRAAVSVGGAVAGVPYLSVAALSSAPVTTLAVPVRQVDN
ncbi:hypothetical protein DFJ68_1999 [Terracoccus luteus]|uniref:Uncharacterized protein n=1 Tax=Terracoccus luteus TaxID=53356 RepID=A0A495XX74_9MICO|nr:DUF5719 family protein [Terracoccus luteus]RKT78552.1 hypothetical protein DFJ68_1999 [Terracoccus luteus]